VTPKNPGEKPGFLEGKGGGEEGFAALHRVGN